MYYYSGQNYNISSRMERENRNTQGVCLQFYTHESMEGSAGWVPLTSEDFWPICPSVGDTFSMKSYYDHACDEESVEKTAYKRWKVISRNIMCSGPAAKEMNGIVFILVEMIDGESSDS